MPAPFIVGWEEWIALPDLGLPAIKAKVDTGARTSALHAHLIEPFGPVDAPLVRFAVHPIAGRTDVEITCSAPILDRREVTSSNGERETRYVIETNARIGPRTWPIEVTLTNRETMAYRMLLGRQAIQEDMFVEPASSFRQPRLSYKLYKHMPRRALVQRSLRIGILTDAPHALATHRLVTAATERGHVVEILDIDALSLPFDAILPALMLGDAPLGHFDTVIPHFDIGNAFAFNLLRQLELMGSKPLNRASALQTLSDPIMVRQLLNASGMFSLGPDRIDRSAAELSLASTPASRASRVLIIGRTAAAALRLEDGRTIASEMDILDRNVCRTATNAARVFRLRLAAIDVIETESGSVIAAVDAMPQLHAFRERTGLDIEQLVIADVETQSQAWVRNRTPMAMTRTGEPIQGT